VDVPPMGYATYVLDERSPECLDPKWTYFRTCGNVPNPPVIDRITDEPIVLENEYVKALFSPATLQMLSFTDKRSGKELISKPSCSFRMITENPIHGMTSWRIGHYMKVDELNTSHPIKLLSVSKGAVRQSICYEIEFGRSRMHVTAYLDVHSVMVNFILRISWRELGSDAQGIPQLNFTVPFDYAARGYLCAIPMGMQERAPLKQDVPCLGFMAGCCDEEDTSVFVMSDCKYGFRGCDDSISLALLRSSFGPDPSPDQCEHTIRLGVGVCKKEEAVQLHEVFAHPLSVCSNQIHEGTIAAEKSWMQLSADARIQAVKPAQDGEGIIVRMHNLKNEKQAATLSLFREIAKAEITDICENSLQNLNVDGKSCTIDMEPCALTTVRLVLK
ncbi:MAG: hypothetical protein IIV87_05355, partial [Oscillospiraceae bacterium]|nr:hypothetical protein [Oscillospiraceae bacterium]